PARLAPDGRHGGRDEGLQRQAGDGARRLDRQQDQAGGERDHVPLSTPGRAGRRPPRSPTARERGERAAAGRPAAEARYSSCRGTTKASSVAVPQSSSRQGRSTERVARPPVGYFLRICSRASSSPSPARPPASSPSPWLSPMASTEPA